MKEETTEIILVEPQQLTRIMDLNQVYEANTISHQRATEASEKLLKTIWRDGMTEQVVEEVKQHMLKLKATLQKMKDRRTPVTQIFDEVRSRFTTLENAIDPTKKDGYYIKFQAELDKYAADQLAKKKAEEQRLQKDLDTKQEEITAEAEIEKQMIQYAEQLITLRKNEILDMFNRMTLDNIDTESCGIDTMHPELSWDDIIGIRNRVSILTRHHTEDWLNQKKVSLSSKLQTHLQKRYSFSMQEFRDELKANLPAKFNELQAMATADAQEKERLEQQRIEREEREKIALDNQQREAADKAAADAERAKTAGSLDAMAQTATLFTGEPGPKVREGYEILVVNPAGWIQLVQFYMEKEGLKETTEKLEKKTLGSIKKFCEAWALKHDEVINSKYLVYQETIKAMVK